MSQYQNKLTTLVVGNGSALTEIILKKLNANGFQSKSWEKLRISDAHKDVRPVLSLPQTLKGTLEGVHTIISTLSIHEEQRSLYDTVSDYKYNLNLLQEAQRAGVHKFIFLVLMNTSSKEKEEAEYSRKRFEESLKNANINYVILRVASIFQEWNTLLDMAHRGKIIIVGNEDQHNPIHLKDIAKACIDLLASNNLDITLEGPQKMTSKQMAQIAFKAHGKHSNLIFLPQFMSNFIHWICKQLGVFSHFNNPILFIPERHEQPYLKKEFGTTTLFSFYQDQVEKIKHSKNQRN